MRKRRWRREALTDNEGKPLAAWTLEDYWIYLNRNYGKEPPVPGKGQRDRGGDLWWFEVYDGGPDGRLVGDAPTLKAAKDVACEDADGERQSTAA